MTTTFDLAPAAAQVAGISGAVRSDQLNAATPCADWTVAVLADHLLGLATAFTAAANKTSAPDERVATGDLPEDWQSRLRDQLDALVEAWRAPQAWEGHTTAGGITMPAEVTAAVAADELVLHGWDLARATGQAYVPDPGSVAASLSFASTMADVEQAARDGLYGPVVPVPADASDFDRLLGIAGRDPHWTP